MTTDATNEKRFRFHTEAREPGNYAEPDGPWETLYLGSDPDEALTEAKRAAGKGLQARIRVDWVRP